MDPTQIDAEHTIERYLAGRMTSSQSEAFEQYVSEHPDIRGQLEETLKFREGLARLRDRGELDELLRRPPHRRWLAYAAAAAVAIVAIGLWLRSPELPVLARSPAELALQRHGHPGILATQVLARTRGTAEVTTVQLPSDPGLIELRMVPSVLRSGTRYRVRLNRLNGPSGRTDFGLLEGVPQGTDGYVTIYIDRAPLIAGDYEVSLSGTGSDGEAVEGDRFLVRFQ